MREKTSMTCNRCGSLLSAVTWTCVRGIHCKPPLAREPFPKSRRLIAAAIKDVKRLGDIGDDK